MGSFLAKGSRVSRKTVDQRCPGLRFFDPSFLPGASDSSSVKTDGFCSGAAGPVFCYLSPAFLECSAVGRRWKSGLRESRLQQDELPVGNGEFDLQHVVTQEELVKRDTPPGGMCGGGVPCRVSALERADFDRAGASPGDCPLQGCPGSRVSLRPGANRVRRDFGWLLSVLESGRVGDGSASLIGCTRSSSVVRRLIGIMRCWSVLGMFFFPSAVAVALLVVVLRRRRLR